MINDLNPIQRQMWAMTKLFLSDNKNKCVCLRFSNSERVDGVISKRFTNDNFDTFIIAIEKHRSGIISFHINDNTSFEFIYCYLDDAVAFTQHNISQNIMKYVTDLFCESEFLLNVELFDT